MAREISGTAVAVAIGGAVLIYAGLRGSTPLQALRDVTSGRPPAVRTGTADLDPSLERAGHLSGRALGGPGARLVAAAEQFTGDRYSQVRRWQVGWSDCSSFVGKSLKAVGITPPGASICVNYLTWRGARKVARSEVTTGDLIVNAAHMVLATSNTHAVGQQNPRDNVQRDKIESLMWGTGPFVCLRVVT